MINNINNSLHLYSAFLGTQNTLHTRRESPQPPPVCSIHLDDVTAAIVYQNAHHTPSYWWRGDRVMKPISVWERLVMKPISVWGWLWENLARMPGSHLYSFTKDILGFLMTTESEDLGLTSHTKDYGLLWTFWSIRVLSLSMEEHMRVCKWR